MTSNDRFTSDLSAAHARIDATRASVTERAPWPLAARFDHAPESSWGPPEILAHLIEMLTYWRIELEKVVAGSGDGSAVPFGRVATDAARLANIEAARTLPTEELYQRFDDGVERFLASWRSWSTSERERLGSHPTRGESTVAAFADRFIVSHMAEHADQLEATLATTPGAD